MKAFLDRFVLTVVPFLGAFIIRFIYYCLRIDKVNFRLVEDLWDEGENAIFSTWHDQLLMIPPVYKGRSARVLISQSKDGELIARTVSYFSIMAVRGSSSRGGREALMEMKAMANEQVDIGITPDGPKGPRHRVKYGVVQLARATGRPVVPLAFACSHGHRFSSWDRFLLPYPWGKAVYYVGEPLSAGEGEAAEIFQQRVQQAMDETTRLAGDYLKRYDLSAV
jgi:lysophospholipid acyltransferase (LPLAT)-like uncharacterized protein